MARKPPPTWAQIASFYAGRPITMGEDLRGPDGATTELPESGKILLGRHIQDRLDAFRKQWAQARTQRERLGLAAYGGNALSTLLHEAMHNRHFNDDYFGTKPADPAWVDGVNWSRGGFRNSGNENQAIALGAELVPDLLQRYFGVQIGSPVSRAFARAAKNGEYRGAYALNGINLP